MILPTPYTLPSLVFTVDRRPVAAGDYSDVYEGKLGGSKVCVKRVRVYSMAGPEGATRVL